MVHGRVFAEQALLCTVMESRNLGNSDRRPMFSLCRSLSKKWFGTAGSRAWCALVHSGVFLLTTTRRVPEARVGHITAVPGEPQTGGGTNPSDVLALSFPFQKVVRNGREQGMVCTCLPPLHRRIFYVGTHQVHYMCPRRSVGVRRLDGARPPPDVVSWMFPFQEVVRNNRDKRPAFTCWRN